MKLSNKVAIVTGGAQGLGRAYCLRLAEEGARVVVADIGDGTRVRDEITGQGGEAMVVRTDVSDEGSARVMAREAVERFGRIDVLVNNAGLFTTIVKKPFHELSVQEWDQVMAVNVKGTFLCSKAVYPQMKKQGKGKIINISSATFFMGAPLFSHYVASKGAVVGLTRAFAREAGEDGISVNAIAPGLTVSEIIRGNAKYPEQYLKMIASGRSHKRDEVPEDLTGTVVFLASDDSDFITGQTIVVDGGMIMY